jgi:hypothetical protein
MIDIYAVGTGRFDVGKISFDLPDKQSHSRTNQAKLWQKRRTRHNLIRRLIFYLNVAEAPVKQPQNNERCDIRIYMMYDFHKVNNKQRKNLIHQRLTG